MIIIQLSKEQLQNLFQNTLQKEFDLRFPIRTPESTNVDNWFDVPGLCEYHPEKPTKQTVYRWVRERRLPFHKRGKKLTFLKSEIDNHIKEGRVKSHSEIEKGVEDFLIRKRGRK